MKKIAFLFPVILFLVSCKKDENSVYEEPLPESLYSVTGNVAFPIGSTLKPFEMRTARPDENGVYFKMTNDSWLDDSLKHITVILKDSKGEELFALRVSKPRTFHWLEDETWTKEELKEVLSTGIPFHLGHSTAWYSAGVGLRSKMNQPWNTPGELSFEPQSYLRLDSVYTRNEQDYGGSGYTDRAFFTLHGKAHWNSGASVQFDQVKVVVGFFHYP